MYCDSQSAIHLAKNLVFHARTKHIDVRYHFVRKIIEDGKYTAFDDWDCREPRRYDNQGGHFDQVQTLFGFSKYFENLKIVLEALMMCTFVAKVKIC